MTVEIVRFNVLLEAETPIAHHSESIGNTAIAMRRKIRQRDGSFAEVPIVTGDTMRHGLRESGAFALLRAAGLLGEKCLTEAALRLLFAGGMITGSQDAVKLDEYHRMCSLIPPLGLLGGCVHNRSIPGRMNVDDALLVCLETASYFPQPLTEWIQDNGVKLQSCRAHVEEVQRVRMDPTLNPVHHPMLLDAGEGVKKQLKKSEKASAEKDMVAKDESKCTMMPRTFETVVQGSLFIWGLSCICQSDLDQDTLLTMVGEFLTRPVVGGKRGVGFGRMRPVKAWKVNVTSPTQVSLESDLSHVAGSLFQNHVQSHATEVREWLKAVVA